MNSSSLVTDALEYYDLNSELYDEKFKHVKYVKIEQAEKEIDHNSIIMYNKDKKQIYKSRYEVIGTFNSLTNTWAWGWTISTLKKNSTTIIRKIMNYGAELDPESSFLKTELITSRFRISDPIQLEIHTAIASYLSKKPVIFKLKSFVDLNITDNNLLDVQNSKNPSENHNFSIYYLFILDIE